MNNTVKEATSTLPVPCFDGRGKRCMEQNSRPYNNYEIFATNKFWRSEKKTLILTNDLKLFNYVKAGACEVMENILKGVKFNDVSNYSLFLGKDNNVSGKLIQHPDDSSLKSFFKALLLYVGRNRGVVFNEEQFSEIVDNHIEMYNNTKIDAPWKVNAILDPLSSQLGIESGNFFNKLEITGPLMTLLKQNPSHIDFFKRMAIVLSGYNDFPKDMKVSEIDLQFFMKNPPDMSFFCQQASIIPFMSSVFQSKILSMNVQQAKYVMVKVPIGIDDSYLSELMDKLTREFISVNEVGNQIFYDENSIRLIMEKQPSAKSYFEALNLFSKDDPNFSLLRGKLISRWKSEGIRNFVENWLEEYDVDDRYQLLQALGSIEDGLESVISMEDSNRPASIHYADYILMKTVEKFGARCSLELVESLKQDKNSMKSEKWLKLGDHYDLLNGVPASWWSSLL